MKTILYLIPHLRKNSTATQLFELIKYLDHKKYQGVVLTFFKDKPESMRSTFVNYGIKVINGNLKRWNIVKQKRLLTKTIKEEDIDLVHSCSILTDIICSNVTFDKPLILTLHCFFYEDLISNFGHLLGNILCKREEKAIRKANAVITVSKALAEKLKPIINRNYTPIENGIEKSLWEKDPEVTKDQLREKLGLKKDSFIVLSTGHLVAIKDPLLLIHAFIEANIPNSVLIMLGSGKMEKECRIYEADNIVFTGRVKNVKDYLYASDVLVSASKSEGLPYAILEAECTGIRMILSDIPQHVEVAGNNDSTLFFPVGNQTALAKQMKNVQPGRVKYDLSPYEAETMSLRYQKVYEQNI